MNKTKKRIVALSTAFAMAFVLVAGLVMMIPAKAATITNLEVTLTAPENGTVINADTDTANALDVKFDNANVYVCPPQPGQSFCYMMKEDKTKEEYPFTYNSGVDNYAYVHIETADTFNNTNITVKGAEKFGDPVLEDIHHIILYVKFPATTSKLTTASVNVTAPAVDSTMTDTTKPNITLPDGANYTVGNMRYMTKDAVDELIIASTNKAASASTTVKEDDVYYAQFYLYPKAGYAFDVDDTTHAPNFKPTVNGDAEYYGAGYSSGDSVQFFVKVTVPKASAPVEPDQPSDTPAATQDTATATTTATTTTAAATTPTTETATATTKTAPKTGDAMPIVAITFVVVGASAIGVVLYRRRRS